MLDLDRRILRQILSNQFTLLKIELRRMTKECDDVTDVHVRKRLAITDKLLTEAYKQES